MEGLGCANGQHRTNFFDNGLGCSFARIHHGQQEFLGSVNHRCSLGCSNVTDLHDLDDGVAGTDAVNGFQRACDNRRLNVVHAAWNDDGAVHLAVLGLHFNVHVSNTRRSLQLAQFEFVPEQALGLAHDGPDDVLALDGAVHFDISPNFILHGLAFSTATAVLISASAV